MRNFYDNSYENFDSIKFEFNGIKILPTDTSDIKIPLTKGLDYGTAIIGSDTLHFFTKFKPDNVYIIQPGSCCAVFTLQSMNKARRGTVTFKNPTNRALGLVVAESNIDTVMKNSTKTTFSYESAMCLFKPCSILITETSYFSDMYNYKNDKRDYDKLWKEQSRYILAKTWFHFLHGEKIEISFDEKKKDIKVKFTGYMSDEEYESIWK